MLRVLVVDDETPGVAELACLLRTDPRIEHVIEADDAAEALLALCRLMSAGERLDAVFLDIGTPAPDLPDAFAHRNGRLADRDGRFGERDGRFADQGGQLADQGGQVVDRGGQFVDWSGQDEVVPVELGGRTRMISRRAVTHVQAHGDYVRMHTGEGSYLVRMPLASLARRWEPAGFIRIHRSTLVASEHVSELRFDGGRAAVQVGGHLLTVSRRHTRRVRDVLVRRFRRAPDATPPINPTPQTGPSTPIGPPVEIGPPAPTGLPEPTGPASRPAGLRSWPRP